MILLDSKGKQGAGLDERKEEVQEKEVEVEEEVAEVEAADEDPLEDTDLPF